MKTHIVLNMLVATSLLLTILSFPVQSITFSEYNTNPQMISTNLAQGIVHKFIAMHHRADYVTVENHRALRNPENDMIVGYAFDLLPSGYIVVSAYRYLTPILAYSWKTSFPAGVADPFVDFICLDLAMQIKNFNSISKEVMNNRFDQWKQYSIEPLTLENMLYEQWPPEGSTDTEGWIETTWSQGSPFNDFCPIDPDNGARSVAGCPAVAMAQIFNYHKSTNSITFTDGDDYYHNYLDRYWIDNDHEKYDFPSFPELNVYLEKTNQRFNLSEPLSDEETAALIFACGVACKQVFSPEGSGTFGVDQAYNAYLRFNCSTVYLYNESSDNMLASIIDEIKHARPVHLAVVNPTWTAGHNLIIDGYNTDGFFHLNFGWGGSYDTWYSLPMDLPYDLTVIEGVIVNIMNEATLEDLSCEGQLQWQNVPPGGEVGGHFIVANTGEPGSLLSWKVLSVPDWGTWTIAPEEGKELTPEDGSLIVNITVVAPAKKNNEFTGGITLVNTENPGDREFITIALTTEKKTRLSLSEQYSFQKFPLLFWWASHFQVISL